MRIYRPRHLSGDAGGSCPSFPFGSASLGMFQHGRKYYCILRSRRSRAIPTKARLPEDEARSIGRPMADNMPVTGLELRW